MSDASTADIASVFSMSSETTREMWPSLRRERSPRPSLRGAQARLEAAETRRPEDGFPLGTVLFGKHKGQPISHVPPEYLVGMCCWQLAATPRCTDPDCDCTSFRCWRVGRFREFRRGEQDWRCWVRSTHPQVVAVARRRVREERRCHKCGNKLVPVGSARANGAWHDDWAERTLHKKCWREIILDGIEGRFEMEGTESESE